MLSLHKIIEQQWFKYVVAGGIAYIVEIGIIIVLVRLFGYSDIIGVAIAFWFGFAASFILQKVYAFNNKSVSKKQTYVQVIKYSALVLVNYVFTLLFVHLLSDYLSVEINRTLALILTTFWNFFLYRSVIFR